MYGLLSPAQDPSPGVLLPMGIGTLLQTDHEGQMLMKGDLSKAIRLPWNLNTSFSIKSSHYPGALDLELLVPGPT